MLDEILENLKKYKDTKCYEINDTSYEYQQLYQYVCNIYKYLQENNKEKIPVIVKGHKDIYMIASFLACSFAGIAYVPIDESMPIQRQNEIIEQIKPKIIIDKTIEKVIENKYYKDIEKSLLKPEDIYYIIFTSGTTGKPKGVKVTYENIQSCIYWLKELCNIENGVILNQANFSFDLSVADIYLSLISRSKHFIIDKKTREDYQILFKRLKQSNANLAVMTPSFADFLLIDKAFNNELMPKLEKILFCGEKLNVSTVKKLKERFKNIDIINSYGPTECTFAVTSTHVTKKDIEQGDIPIGKAKKDVNIFIVDKELQILKNGQIGEILISGKSVANGYVKTSENEAKFINYNGEKAYLTGDMGCIKDEELYYKCRKDNQIKYKGYRIEIADIEKSIYKLEYTEKVAIATIKDESNKVLKIVAFIKLKQNYIYESIQIKNDISKLLPEYMCPTVKIVESFPLNQNGKCDMEKLLKEF